MPRWNAPTAGEEKTADDGWLRVKKVQQIKAV